MEKNHAKKFKKIANAHVAPHVIVNNHDYNIGSRIGGNNAIDADSWLCEVPLPIQLAQLAIDADGEMNPALWESIATQIFAKNEREWNRQTNRNLNGSGLFRWDMSLSRCVIPYVDEDVSYESILRAIWTALCNHQAENGSAPYLLASVLSEDMDDAPPNVGHLVVEWIQGDGGGKMMELLKETMDAHVNEVHRSEKNQLIINQIRDRIQQETDDDVGVAKAFEYADKLQNFEIEIAKLQNTVAVAAAALKAAREECQGTENGTAKCKAELAAAQAELDKMQEERAALAEETAKCNEAGRAALAKETAKCNEAVGEAVRAALAEREAALAKENAALAKENAALAKENAALAEETAKFNEALTVAEAARAALAEENAALATALAQYSLELAEANDKKAALAEETAKCNEAGRAALAKANQEKGALEKENAALAEETVRWQALHQYERERNEAGRAELAEANQEKGALAKEKAALAEETVRLEALTQYAAELVEENDKKAELAEETAKFNEAGRAALAEETAKANQENAELAEETAKLKELVKTLQEILDGETTGRYNEEAGEIVRLTGELGKMKSAIELYEKKQNDVRAATNKLKRELNDRGPADSVRNGNRAGRADQRNANKYFAAAGRWVEDVENILSGGFSSSWMQKIVGILPPDFSVEAASVMITGRGESLKVRPLLTGKYQFHQPIGSGGVLELVGVDSHKGLKIARQLGKRLGASHLVSLRTPPAAVLRHMTQGDVRCRVGDEWVDEKLLMMLL